MGANEGFVVKSDTIACNCAQSHWAAPDTAFSPLRSEEIGIFVPTNLIHHLLRDASRAKRPSTSHLPCAQTEHVPTARKLPPTSPLQRGTGVRTGASVCRVEC